MKIAVPSYNRVSIFKTKTLKVLIENQVDIKDIYLFVASQDQYDLYKPEMPEDLKIIIGEKGMCNIRNFMSDYFDEGEIVCYMDDDIVKVKIKNDKTFLDILNDSHLFLKNSPYALVGFPPTFNEFFNKDNGIKTGNLFCMGGFYITKNDRELRVDDATTEDRQRTLQFYHKYGGVARNCDLMIKANTFTAGGVNEADGRNYEKYYHGYSKLYYQYSTYLGLTEKKIPYISKDPVPHFKFKTFKQKPDLIKPKVIQLPKVQASLFEPLLKMLTETSLSIKQDEESAKKVNGSYRKNFPRHRADIFGVVKLRSVNGGGCAISRCSQQKQKLYEEIKG
jgi:hypothetical protein